MSRIVKMVLTGALLLALTAGMASAQSALATVDCSADGTRDCNGTSGPDTITEGGGDDTIRAMEGNDEVFANRSGGDEDIIFLRQGADFANADDGDGMDVVNCGAGRDRVIVDRGDETMNCDGNVTRR